MVVRRRDCNRRTTSDAPSFAERRAQRSDRAAAPRPARAAALFRFASRGEVSSVFVGNGMLRAVCLEAGPATYATVRGQQM
jgi:hypothetical protein